MGGLSGSKATPQAPAGLGPSGYDPGRCFQLLANLHDALVLTSEFAEHETVAALVEGSTEFKEASDFLLANQHTNIGANQ